MFHIYSIITLVWGYSLFIAFDYLIYNYSFKFKKVLILILFIIVWFWIYKTYNITLIPQRYYYIDYTSPKPNFKMAYDYLEKNHSEAKIVSWFPHICYWYNLKNTEKCKYSIRINLIWNKNIDKKLKKEQNESYTNVAFIDNLKDITNLKNYYFIIDDLTFKNALNKALINDIIKKCSMIYKDVWNYETSSFIWIWRCN